MIAADTLPRAAQAVEWCLSVSVRQTGKAMENKDPHPATHIPVMLTETLALLNPQPGEIIVDGTLGLGGHTHAIAKLLDKNSRLIGIDRDPNMLARATENLRGVTVETVRGNFSEMGKHLQGLGLAGADGILLDLGVASPQIDEARRGFSYRSDGPLDMRMSADENQSAADWLNQVDEEELGRVIREYGEERYWRRIARAIVSARSMARLRSTGQLAEIIRRAAPGGQRRLHPARRAFQAIRIYVNREIEHLERFLQTLPGLLNPGGRCVVITYHSLEDRPVKLAFRENVRAGVYESLTRKPLRATTDEVRSNPRSRSAKIRAVRRTAEGGAK